jgi:hypothetical protein
MAAGLVMRLKRSMVWVKVGGAKYGYACISTDRATVYSRSRSKKLD